jgi:DNA primase
MSTDVGVLGEVTNAAAQIFFDELRRRAAISYLGQRGIEASALPTGWLLGYAPPGWTRLLDKLCGSFAEQALLDAGVARVSSRGTLIDTFRDRVIFGIRAVDGTIGGFIGRDLSGHPSAPKYLNTHQHALFDKSGLLFGLHEGRDDAHSRQPVVVEGPLDVLAIAARQQVAHAGLLPVAACGTAFTARHAHMVAEAVLRSESPVVVAMDGDAAGRRSSLAAGEQLRSAGVDLRIAMLPNGSDPAAYLAQPDSNIETFRAEHGRPLIHAHVQSAISRQGDRTQWIEGRLAALRSITSYLATYPPVHTARQVPWLAEALQLAPSTVTAALADAYLASDRQTTPSKRVGTRAVGAGAYIGL